MNSNSPTVGVLIRFANSEATLPHVLEALNQQTVQPNHILGVASHSTDRSRDLMQAADAEVIEWPWAYDHSRVLNFGLRQLHTDLVLVLSSHTVLESTDAIERMVACFNDERVACVSAKWDDDPFYSDAVDWNELKTKGLRFGSIYSNSMGMIRRGLWEQLPFDEKISSSEDYAWAIEQLRRGHVCRRLDLPFNYKRSGTNRDREFARIVFQFARQHGLPVTWLGVTGAVKEMLSGKPSHATRERLLAWLVSTLSLH